MADRPNQMGQGADDVEIGHYKGVTLTRADYAPNDEAAALQMRDAILDKVVDANDIDVPQALLEAEISNMVCALDQQLKYQCGGCSDPISFMRNDMDVCMAQIRADAARLVKSGLVLDAIIEAEGFEVTGEELAEEVAAMSVRCHMSVETIKAFLGPDLTSLKHDLQVKKAFDFIYDHAVIS